MADSKSIFRFEGNGRIKEYPGNHSAFLEARKREAPEPGEAKTTVSRPAPVAGTPAGPRKLSYNERREFEELEKRIEVAEARKVELERLLAASSSDLVAVESSYSRSIESWRKTWIDGPPWRWFA